VLLLHVHLNLTWEMMDGIIWCVTFVRKELTKLVPLSVLVVMLLMILQESG